MDTRVPPSTPVASHMTNLFVALYSDRDVGSRGSVQDIVGSTSGPCLVSFASAVKGLNNSAGRLGTGH